MGERAENNQLMERAAVVDTSPWPGPHGHEYTVSTDDLSVTVMPADAGRICSITAFGHEILRQYEPGMKVFQYGAFPMTPWAGRLGGGLLYSEGLTYQMPVNQSPHALHGLGRLKEWTLDSAEEDRLDLSMSLDPWWPWPASTSMRVEVKANSLRITQRVETVKDSFPAQLGLHPWFRRHLEQDSSDTEVSLDFSPEWQAEKGTNKLPTGRRIPPLEGPWDDCFGFFPTFSANLIWEELEVHLSSSHSYATVFSEPQDALCVEPQTSVPNVLNSAPGTSMVTPGRPLELVSDLTFFSRK